MNPPTTRIRRHQQVPFTAVSVVRNRRLTVQLVGELDLACVELLEDCDHDADPTIREVVVDASELTFIDTAGVCSLLAFRQRQQGLGRRVHVIRAGQLVRKVVGLCGLTDLITDATPAGSS